MKLTDTDYAYALDNEYVFSSFTGVGGETLKITGLTGAFIEEENLEGKDVKVNENDAEQTKNVKINIPVAKPEPVNAESRSARRLLKCTC